MGQSIHTQLMPDLFGNMKTGRRASVLVLLSHEHQICFPLTVNDGIHRPSIKALLLGQCSLQARAICNLESKAIEPDHYRGQCVNPNE